MIRRVLGSESIATRFGISVTANVVRAAIGFVTTLYLARALGPVQFGHLAYLLISFVAIRGLLEMGTHNAFNSFISRSPQPYQHFVAYGVWLLLQPVTMAAVIAFVLPSNMFAKLWPSQPLDLILLTLVAVFMSEQVRLAVSQVAESFRKTGYIQSIVVTQVFGHLILIIVLDYLGLLTVRSILWLLIIEFSLIATGTFPSFKRWILERQEPSNESPFELLPLVRRYGIYCTPLVIGTYFGTARLFGDRWLVQHFAGPREQSFFAIGEQYSMIGLIATASILRVLWKEVAESVHQKNEEVAKQLYLRVTAVVTTVGALVAGLFVPWSADLLGILLGAQYRDAALVFSVMLIYAIFQSIQQIGGTLLLATGKTWRDMWLSAIPLFAGLPLTYFLVAPREAHVAGLALGALGLALKTLGIGFVTANLTAYWISHIFKWHNPIYRYQLVIIPACLAFGMLSKDLVTRVLGIPTSTLSIVASLAAAGPLYLAMLWALLRTTGNYLLPGWRALLVASKSK